VQSASSAARFTSSVNIFKRPDNPRMRSSVALKSPKVERLVFALLRGEYEQRAEGEIGCQH
jgi:hypothetical protein